MTMVSSAMADMAGRLTEEMGSENMSGGFGRERRLSSREKREGGGLGEWNLRESTWLPQVLDRCSPKKDGRHDCAPGGQGIQETRRADKGLRLGKQPMP